MKMQSLRALYLEQLKDLYSAEHHLIKALPKMARTALSEELRNAFADHLEKTREHAHRIETIFEPMGEWARGKPWKALAAAQRVEHYEIAGMVAEELRHAFADHREKTREHAHRIEIILEQMGEWARGKKSKAMKGRVKEGGEVSKANIDDVKDAALIAAAQRVEHYEIAGYGCVRTYAMMLGEEDAAALLAQTCDDKKKAGEALDDIAAQLNREVRRSEVNPKSEWRRRPANSRWPASLQKLAGLKVN